MNNGINKVINREKKYRTQIPLAKRLLACMLAALMVLAMCACAGQTSASGDAGDTEAGSEAREAAYLTADDITVNETYENSTGGEHAIEVSGEEAEYANIGVTKTGDSEGDEADFYGENSAVFATEQGTLTIKDSLIQTNGTHANAVFSYGEGTTVNISDSVIETEGNCSGGLMTTGGGTMNASNLTINTKGRSSAAIRSDRGGGTVTVNGGYYKTEGLGSPVIYSTADITVSDSYLESTTSEGVVVEGKNSVTLNNDILIADNTEKNSDNSDNFNAVMIYQSMSGDADEGKASFTANGGSITNKNGDVFFVNNTATDITLTDVEITNEDADGAFLRAAAAGWGNSGSNGGKVNLFASAQVINGNIVVDDISVLNMYLKDSSAFTGAINTDGQSGDVYVEVENGSTWTLTADSYVSGLTVTDADAIDLNGHKLYIDGKEYTAGETSEGTAFEVKTESSGSGMPGGASGDFPAPPSGEKPSGEPPAKPDGASGDFPAPPSGEKPSGDFPEPPSGEKPSGDFPAPPSGEKPGSEQGSGSSSDTGSSAT